MILYGSTMSPFVRKVAAYAAEKGIALDIRPTGIGDTTPEFIAASPFRKMPALVDGDYCLSDSSAIIHYLEAKHPEPALIPADPRERGRVIWFEEFADTILFACGAKMFFNRVVAPRFLGREGDLVVADKAEREELPPILDYLEGVVPDDNFLVGGRLTLADLAVASPFANFDHSGVTIDTARYPKTGAYTKAILARPSFVSFVAREAAFLERTA
ncbi:glutathione S-transferase family protein [Sphingomonas xanthus]|uniref:Glutathione S-transferase family protein n=1 Tax=Sphingomonas xanthus TaxID=2594473 RepID=A0A516IQA5_9SPHN|nr:glutathione S-transferase family protein [Sphingomonas xanthus]QDP18944.1 glutathione S-transferase family protein [Sphingomonas xanthus]